MRMCLSKRGFVAWMSPKYDVDGLELSVPGPPASWVAVERAGGDVPVLSLLHHAHLDLRLDVAKLRLVARFVGIGIHAARGPDKARLADAPVIEHVDPRAVIKVAVRRAVVILVGSLIVGEVQA